MRGLVVLLLVLPAWAGTAVHRDGSILRHAEVAVDAARGVAQVGQREYALDSLYLVENDDGTLLWARDLTARLRGYEFLARAGLREAAARLARDALKAKDIGLARDLFELASRHGYWGQDAEKLALRIEALAKRPNLRPNPAQAERVREAARELRFLHAELVADRARNARGEARLHLLREALRRGQDAPGARRLLDEERPQDPPLQGRVFWLDWRLDLAARGAVLAPADAFALEFAKKFWRKDVYGLEAGPILLVTPVEDTELVGRCLAFGQLLCKALATLFRDHAPRRRAPLPMNVLLFPSQEEYKAKSGMVSAETPDLLDWTAGHYSPIERVSRFFWHKDRDAERRIIGTCVHELTHQWLRERNPAYAEKETRNNPRTPGYWIVEGFATFMQEGRYDIETGTWSLFQPRSRSLDVVATLKGKRVLVPWPTLFHLDALQFRDLDPNPDTEITRRWALGYGKISDTRVFYEQSAAACHFLYHAEGGKHRRALLDYVVHHYTNRQKKLTPEAAFGMSGAELGRKVEEFAKAVADGWRPE